MSGIRSIPWLILVLGIGFLALSGWSIHRATLGASAVTDEDYYHHGLRFNQTLLEKKAAAALGWEAAVNLRGQVITVHLYDRNRRDVTGARGSLTLFVPGAKSETTLALRETSAGIYQAEFPAGLQGEQPAELAFERDDAKLSKRLLFALR